MIERRDGADGPQGLAGGEDLALLAVGREIAGEDLAIVLDAELCGQAEDVECAAYLVEGVLFGETGLGRDEIGDLITLRHQALGHAVQDLLALVAGELRVVTRRDLEGAAHVRRRGLGYGADHLVRVGVEDVDGLVPLEALPGDADSLAQGLGGGPAADDAQLRRLFRSHCFRLLWRWPARRPAWFRDD